jgi:pyridoxal phosphate enzyme (YggS family)
LDWHFIGHLQSNKVKYIAPFVYLIHGVDSLKLLTEINKEALKNNRIISCLLQLYIAKEETKFGLNFEEATELLSSKEFSELKNISIKGFMAMASNTDDVEQIKNEFRSANIYKMKFPNFPILSIGMSSDYELAIKEGSTLIRVGSKIFGERNYAV